MMIEGIAFAIIENPQWKIVPAFVNLLMQLFLKVFISIQIFTVFSRRICKYLLILINRRTVNRKL